MLSKYFIIIAFFVTFTVTSPTSEEKALNEWISDTSFNQTSNRLRKLIQTLNFECSKEKVKADGNGNKKMNQSEATDTIFLATLRCLIPGEDEAFKEIIDEMLEFIADIVSIENLECYKWGLYKLDPDSRLLGDFNPNNMEISKEKCEEINLNTLEKIQGALDNDFRSGSILRKCEALVEKEITLFFFKLMVFSFETNDEIKQHEIRSLIDLLKQVIEKLENCMRRK